MIRNLTPALLLGLLLPALLSCDRVPDKHWSEGLPYYTPAVIIAPNNTSPTDLLFSGYMEMLDGMTPAANSQIEAFLSNLPSNRMQSRGLAIIPHNSDVWMPVWIMETRESFLADAADRLVRPYTGNRYRFHGATIYQNFLSDDVIIYAVQLRNWVYFTQSSYAIEEVVRAYTGRKSSLQATEDQLQAGRLLLNVEYLDRLAALETAVRYRPRLYDAFRGSGLVSMRINERGGTGTGTPALEFSGTMPLSPASDRAKLLGSLSARNHSNLLDRYVSLDAAAAVFLSHAPAQAPPEISSDQRVDRHLTDRPEIFAGLSSTLSPNFAFAAFASSGFLSVGEFAYIRQLSDRNGFVRSVEQLVDDGLISQEGSNTYLVRGKVLADLLSGGLSSFDIHYLTVTGDAAIVTQRPGLAQKLASDRTRRRSLHFDENYLAVRRSFDEQLSGFLYVQSQEFMKYVESLLNTVHSMDIVTDQFDLLAAGVRLLDEGTVANLTVRTYNVERTTRPFEERWLVQLDGTELSGAPVLANLGGGSRDEVIAATTGGLVVALAADGTQVFRVRTGTDQPVGPPVAIDWYANNQMAILIGAGDKIYAWNNTGVPLPNFPIQLPEAISAPIHIADITRNGLPEIVVATADRRIHVLDQRGNNISGWPQSVNASIRTKPITEMVGNRRVIFAYAENILFGWDANGSVRSGFPVFSPVPLRGPLFFHREHLLAGTADGKIIAAGRGDYFSDSYAEQVDLGDQSTDAVRMQAIQVSNSGVVLRPAVSTHTINVLRVDDAEGLNDEQVRVAPAEDQIVEVTEPLLFLTSDNGSLFALSQQGALRFTQSLGQPAMPNSPPIVADLNRNGRTEILGLASFGRMYGWDLQRGERFLSIPTTSVQYPVTGNLINNGLTEIIAGSRDGLRCWSINRPATQ